MILFYHFDQEHFYISSFSSCILFCKPSISHNLQGRELEDEVSTELKKWTISWARTQHCLCEEQWAVANCILVPYLLHITRVCRHYKNYSKWKSMPNLSCYIDMAFKSELFKATSCRLEYVAAGWAKYFP